MGEEAREFAAVYLRLSLGLDGSDQTRFLLGQALKEAGLPVPRIRREKYVSSK